MRLDYIYGRIMKIVTEGAMDERYYSTFACAQVRGQAIRKGVDLGLDPDLLEKPLELLNDDEKSAILDRAKESGMKLYHFKRSDGTLPRVTRVLGFLKAIYFESLLDVGSGRGVFLLPFLEKFPYIPVTSIDIIDRRVEMLSDITKGGIDRLIVKKASICDRPFPPRSFDVVTLLEVLEHIPDVESAIRSAVETARKYVIVTVPSKEDSNPEHIHLLTKDVLTRYFNACGVTKLSFESVPGHLFMIARID